MLGCTISIDPGKLTCVVLDNAGRQVSMSLVAYLTLLLACLALPAAFVWLVLLAFRYRRLLGTALLAVYVSRGTQNSPSVGTQISPTPWL